MPKFNAHVKMGKGGAEVALPFDPNDVWGTKATHHITGTLQSVRIRGRLEQSEKGYVLRLGPAWLRECPLSDGQVVTVELEAEGPQLDSLPPDVAQALLAEPEAAAFFASLATFYRTGYLRWIDSNKKPDIRAARIEETVRLLKAGQKSRPS